MLSLIDHAHAAGAELFENAVVGNRAAHPLLSDLVGPPRVRIEKRQLARRHFQGRLFHKAFRFALLRKQRFHFPPQLHVPRAGLFQESRPLALFPLQGGTIQRRHVFPAFTVHHATRY